MSELLSDDDPGPLSGLKQGLHYYDIHNFLMDIGPDMKYATVYSPWPEPVHATAEVQYTIEESPMPLERQRQRVVKMGLAVRFALQQSF